MHDPKACIGAKDCPNGYKWLVDYIINFNNLVCPIQQGAQKCDLFKLFHADINQSEVEDSFQLASDWITSARKNVNYLAVTLLGSLL